LRLLVFRVGRTDDAGVLAQLFIASLVVAVDGQALSPLFPLLSRQFGVDPGTVVLATGAFQTGLLLAPTLARSDRRDRVMLIAGLATLAGACWMCAGVSRFWPFVGARFLAGLASAVFGPALGAYLGDRFAYGRRGRAVALTRSAWSVAGVVGIPLAASVVQRAGTEAFFRAMAGAALAGAVMLGLALPPASAAGQHGPRPVRPVSYRWAFWLSALWIAGPCCVFFFLAAYLETRFGLSTPAVGVAFSLCALAGLAGSLAGGWAADRWGKLPVARAGLGLMASSLGGMLATAKLVPVLLLAAFMTLGLELGWAAFQAMATELDPHGRSRAVASTTLGYGAGSIAVAVLSPWLWLMGGFPVAVALGLTAALLALALAAGGGAWVPREAEVA